MGRMLMQLFCTAISAISATAMTLRYPKYPQNNMALGLQWAGGTPPVRYLLHIQRTLYSLWAPPVHRPSASPRRESARTMVMELSVIETLVDCIQVHGALLSIHREQQQHFMVF